MLHQTLFVRLTFLLIYILESKRNILILLAGTSGTGKSTLASLLGSRLGISTVLSTDTIRHVMRNFVAKEEDPIIFASTYETAAFVSSIHYPNLYCRSLMISNQRKNAHLWAIKTNATRFKQS